VGSLGEGDQTAASAAVLPARLDLTTHVVERVRPEPVDVTIHGRPGAGSDMLAARPWHAVQFFSVTVRRRRVCRLLEVKGQVVDDVIRLRHRRRHRRNKLIETRLRQKQNARVLQWPPTVSTPADLEFCKLGLTVHPNLSQRA